MSQWLESVTSGNEGWEIHCRWNDESPRVLDQVIVSAPYGADTSALRYEDYLSRAKEALLKYGVDLAALKISPDTEVGEGVVETVFFVSRVTS